MNKRKMKNNDTSTLLWEDGIPVNKVRQKLPKFLNIFQILIKESKYQLLIFQFNPKCIPKNHSRQKEKTYANMI